MKAWSHSALKTFETCPKKYYKTSVTKEFSDAGGEAMQWGNEVHKAFEDYFKKGKKFPLGMKQFEKLAAAIGAKVSDTEVEQMTETKLAINKSLEPVGYFAKDVWVRAVVDFGFRKGNNVMIFDWKTGKKKSDDDQLALMAGMMFAQDADIDKVVSTFVWLQEEQGRQMEAVTFERKDIASIWQRFLPRVEEFQNAFDKEDFPARPNRLCRRYCPVSSCPYHGT